MMLTTEILSNFLIFNSIVIKKEVLKIYFVFSKAQMTLAFRGFMAATSSLLFVVISIRFEFGLIVHFNFFRFRTHVFIHINICCLCSV